MLKPYYKSNLKQVSLFISFKFTLSKDGFYLDHAENCELEEDSVDRLWLVIRSLKSPEGKYVIIKY